MCTPPSLSHCSPTYVHESHTPCGVHPALLHTACGNAPCTATQPIRRCTLHCYTLHAALHPALLHTPCGVASCTDIQPRVRASYPPPCAADVVHLVLRIICCCSAGEAGATACGENGGSPEASGRKGVCVFVDWLRLLNSTTNYIDHNRRIRTHKRTHNTTHCAHTHTHTVTHTHVNPGDA